MLGIDPDRNPMLMRLALSLGDENGVSMPVAAASNEAFKKARSMGLGDLDFSAVYETVKGTSKSTSFITRTEAVRPLEVMKLEKARAL